MNDDLFVTPTWLEDKVIARITLMINHGALKLTEESGAKIVFSFLDEGKEDMTPEERERWERTCDGCGIYIPEDGETLFYSGHLSREIDGVQILLGFGMCDDCKKGLKKK